MISNEAFEPTFTPWSDYVHIEDLAQKEYAWNMNMYHISREEILLIGAWMLEYQEANYPELSSLQIQQAHWILRALSINAPANYSTVEYHVVAHAHRHAKQDPMCFSKNNDYYGLPALQDFLSAEQSPHTATWGSIPQMRQLRDLEIPLTTGLEIIKDWSIKNNDIIVKDIDILALPDQHDTLFS